MTINKPKIPDNVTPIDDFSTYSKSFIDEEMPICDIISKDEQLQDNDFYKIEVKQSLFENCTFLNCCFENSYFVDTVFKDCNLSNCNFKNAFFERCQFISCKCVGVNMIEASFKHTSMIRSNFQYSCFDEVHMTNVFFENIDFTESSMSQAKLKQFKPKETRFIHNNFFKTALSGIDFTNNELIAPIVSMPPIELKGAKINSSQAVDLIGLWGIIVE